MDKRRQVLPNTEQVLCGKREAFESPLPSAVGTCLSMPTVAWKRTHRRRMERSNWTEADERHLIAFLTDHKAEAGDGFSYKQSTWNAAARYMATQASQRGAAKTAESCKNKWSQVSNRFFS